MRDFDVLPVMKYTPRFIQPEQEAELCEYYRLARVALSGKPCSRYHRMVWAADQFHKAHPEVTSTAAYKDLDGLLLFTPEREG